MTPGRKFNTLLTGIKFPNVRTTEFNEPQELSLFYKVGGYPVIEEAIDIMYERVLADEELSGFFFNDDIKFQSARMKAFLCRALGVTSRGESETIPTSSPFIKVNMRINQMVTLINHLRQSFLDLGVEASLVDEAMICFLSSRKTVQ